MTEHSSKRVVITGLGLVSPLGSNLETLWSNLTAGKSGICQLQSVPTGQLPFRSGGEVQDFTGDIEDYGPLDKLLQRAIKKNMKVMCREIEMGVAAAQKALLHSGLGDERDPERCGCHFGCDYILTRPEEYADGVRNCRSEWAESHLSAPQPADGAAAADFDPTNWPVCGLPKVNPLWLLKYLPNMPNSHVSIYNDFRGPNNSITLREASMNLSVAEAASIIRRGAADVMLVGATGSRIHPLRAAIMTMTDRLAAETEDPAHMARPFDSTCDGIVLGEGAGALLLESAEHAERRGAKIWGEIIGEGSAMVGPRGNRDFLREAVYASMSSALNMAGKRLPKRWHLHAQGLSSPTADASEGKAIAQLLSQFEAIPVTAAKSYTGNLGAGSAAMELICSILALHHGQLFPIRNLSQPASYATWRPATLESEAGQAFLHSSYTLQGQTSSLVVAAA